MPMEHQFSPMAWRFRAVSVVSYQMVPVHQIMGSHVQGAVPEMRILLREKVPVHPIP